MYDVWLMLHFIGLALGVGTGFAMFTLGLAAADMAPADRGAFMRRAFALSRNASIGLTLLVVSGVGLVMSLGVSAALALGGPMFHIKLTLVVVMIGLFGYMQVLIKKAKLPDGAASMARLPMISRVMLLLGIAVIISAVLAFH
ncbi:MAG: hypothetical protein HQ485_04575 [Acidobacteria bacterium]|jgi:uncharacterized membrane protein|nr:hypothetical protein [Acidobacteriota bacterium]